ncbi:GpE family phage tail protein [Escherichia coli]|nr:GpE family phage tail protein [Escherichia coli]KAB3437792.1 GpE family phage tail protein [Escherichia coli]
MADIATIFHWPPSVTDVMPLPEPPPRLQGWQWVRQ